MTINEVWKLLEIEPTRDKRLIKHAYARAIKKYHPEDNPEEFQRVYDAYKLALAFAENTKSTQESNVLNFAGRTAEQNQPQSEVAEEREFVPDEQNRIQMMFQNMKSEREKKLFIFQHKWEWYLKNPNNDSAKREMLIYVQTHWFTDIKDDIRQLYSLEENRMHYLKLRHLLESDPAHFLYEDIEKWQRMAKPTGDRTQKKYRFRLLLIVAVLIGSFFFHYIYYSTPRGTKSSSSNDSMEAERKNEIVLENEQLQKLAEEWDIMCDLCYREEPWNDGDNHCLLLGYYNMDPQLNQLHEDLKVYMKRFREFVQSEEVQKLKNIEGVSFCVGNVFSPESFIGNAGNVPHPLLYDLAELPEAKDMAQDLEWCIFEYIFHMEPWQLEADPDYEALLEVYEERIQERKTDPAVLAGSAVITTAEDLGIQVVVYQVNGVDCISTGDMYRLAKKAGVQVSVYDGSSGIEWNGGIYFAGSVTCVQVLEMFAEE